MEKPSDDDLLRVSLSALSKGGLASGLSSRIILDIYIRWLELHRQKESKRTSHWGNTILHWSQALRSRGFSESDVLAKIDEFKLKNGPFRSNARRFPPTSKEISKAYEDLPRSAPEVNAWKSHEVGRVSPQNAHQFSNNNNAYQISPRKGFVSYDYPPPLNYVCNRCGKSGHHLQNCPTNLDPSYDILPDAEYVCLICKLRGDHFKSLCPISTDPYSLTQKRKAVGIEPLNKREERSILGEWEMDRTNVNQGGLHNVAGDRILPIRDNTHFRRELSADSHLMDRDVPERNIKRYREDSPVKEQAKAVKRVKIEDPKGWIGDKVIKEERVDRIAAREIANIRRTVQVQKKDIAAELPRSCNIDRLIQFYGDTMTEVVNPIRRRPTALDMWQQDDMNRLQRLAISSPDISPSPSPESDLTAGSASELGSAPESVENYQDGSPHGSGSSQEYYYSPYERANSDDGANSEKGGDSRNKDGRLTPYRDADNDIDMQSVW